MLILGKNTDDTGTQLECLTKRLLALRHYQNLTLNVATAGGHEIDITGEMPSTVPGDDRKRRLIGECKAHRNPITMGDWLKFLGKVYSEQQRTHREVDGLFVALSGANGNVIGNYDEMRQNGTPVTLIEGDTLLVEVYKAFSDLVQREVILDTISKMTSRPYVSIEIAYRNAEFFWVVVFPESNFSIFTQNGEPLNHDENQEIINLTKERIGASEYLILSEEARLLGIRIAVEKLLVTRIAEAGGRLALEIFSDQIQEEQHIIKEAINSLRRKSWIRFSETYVEISVLDKPDPHAFQEVTLFIMNGTILGRVARSYFSSKFFKTNLTIDLIKHISVIQGNLEITEDLSTLLLELLPISPSACVQCLTPQALITTHRNKSEDFRMDETDRTILKRLVLEAVRADFSQRGLYEYLYEEHGLREIETHQSIQVKTETGVIIESDISVRHGIGAAAESLGGGYIGILMVDSAPQPWEIVGLDKQNGQTNDQKE